MCIRDSTCSGQKCTLTGWQAANGFDGTEPAVAYYYNAGDLGLGREMHCRQNGADAACYVTNYGPGFPPAADPIRALTDATNHDSPIATVAMEYGPTADSTGVKFYVYLHSAGDILVPQAVLDSQGPKNVPQLCIACHGGFYDPTAHKVTNASFLPFDVFSFGFLPGILSLADEQEQFRLLNSIVLSTNPNASNTNNPIGNLINGWYPCGVQTIGCAAVNTYVPPPPSPGWTGHNALYVTIPRVYCRTCHVAQGAGLDWTQYTNFNNPAFLQPNLCNNPSGTNNRNMPHAEVPFNKFWFSTDPYGPQYLADPTTGVGFTGDSCPR